MARNDSATRLSRKFKSRMFMSKTNFMDKARIPNTYRMESLYPFETIPVQKILIETIEKNITSDLKYDPDEIPLLISRLSNKIRDKIKSFGFERYKIVVVISIGEKYGQSVDTSLRMLRDIQRDKYVTYNFENLFLYGYAAVFGFYHE